VGDVVEALLAAGESSASGSLNVGTGVETSVLELGRLISAQFGRAFEPDIAPPRPGEVRRIAIDSSRAERELGWRTQTTLGEGLSRTAASFREA
jgi:UDP-glucose 4-epimerase